MKRFVWREKREKNQQQTLSLCYVSSRLKTKKRGKMITIIFISFRSFMERGAAVKQQQQHIPRTHAIASNKRKSQVLYVATGLYV